MTADLETIAAHAREGDASSVEALVLAIQDRIYGLAVRMLWHPEDARDATQEILLRIVTHLGTFRGDSSFITWCWRIASNYLLTRKRRAEAEELDFERFGAQLDEGLTEEPRSLDAEQRLIVEEIKIGCTQGMLLCLDREHPVRVDEMHELERAAAVFRSHPAYEAPEAFIQAVRSIIRTADYKVLR